jgi:exosortase E/protease (VPEID-CTERM system)
LIGQSERQSAVQESQIESTTWTLGLRWVVALAVIIGELIWLTSTYQAPDVSNAPDWAPLLTVFNDGYHYTAGIVFGAAFLLIASASMGGIAVVLRNQPGYSWWPSAMVHGLLLLGFARLSALGFGAGTHPPELSATWLVAWLAIGAATFGSWLMIIAPARAWRHVLRQHWPSLVLAVSVGIAAWLGGLLVQSLWVPLAGGTLRLSALLLSPIYPEMTYDPAAGLVGSSAFIVEIYPVCSGYEGIALVSVFVATYLWIFRENLRFPQALILLPIGIVSIWLTNVLRVAALIVIGTSVSPEVASLGFHSQAGWIAFTFVSLGLIAISHRWLSSAGTDGSTRSAGAVRPEFALLAPLMALMATTMITAAGAAGFDALYPLGIIVTGAVLWHYRAAYRPLFGSLSWEPFAIGTLVFVIWLILVPASSDGQALVDRLSEWPSWLAATWLLIRVLGSVVAVPLAEELAFRGYLIRKLVSKDFEQVHPGQFTWFSFVVSSLLFGLLHQNLLAGTLAGGAFALALYRRGYLGDAILAHMTSNALIAAAVIGGGHWGLWA